MTVTFTGLSDATIKHWHDFALEHLLDSDRLTRNLYDLRQVREIPEKAIHTAIEVNNDPAARNIRLAVVVSDEELRQAVRKIYYSVMPETSAAIKVFSDLESAEAWLSRPLDKLA
jgi:threonine synthase